MLRQGDVRKGRLIWRRLHCGNMCGAYCRPSILNVTHETILMRVPCVQTVANEQAGSIVEKASLSSMAHANAVRHSFGSHSTRFWRSRFQSTTPQATATAISIEPRLCTKDRSDCCRKQQLGGVIGFEYCSDACAKYYLNFNYKDRFDSQGLCELLLEAMRKNIPCSDKFCMIIHQAVMRQVHDVRIRHTSVYNFLQCLAGSCSVPLMATCCKGIANSDGRVVVVAEAVVMPWSCHGHGGGGGGLDGGGSGTGKKQLNS